MTTPDLSGAYLSIRYEDPPRRLVTWRVYERDGRVRVFDGEEWYVACTLDPDGMARAQRALDDCGVTSAADLEAPPHLHDPARVTWRWSIGGRTGSLVNRAHPAVGHPAMDCAMDVLLDIEAAARARGDAADGG
ncbi:MAG TPA: hypothetical protein PKD59_01305 [Miltoncostaeaceae bacterium]|nr:hypothetical protein [Miltoncostaeaceae bacterium]